jgi:hypothetical protein
MFAITWPVRFDQRGISESAMRDARHILLALALLCLANFSIALDVQRFDGKWLTTVSCPNFRDALGFSYQFVSTVKDGVLHGLHGTEGEPGSLQIDGTIPADGKASLYAKGRTGSKEYVPGRDTPRGTEYGYNIEAHFDGSAGTGSRVEGRPCSLKFAKQ